MLTTRWPTPFLGSENRLQIEPRAPYVGLYKGIRRARQGARDQRKKRRRSSGGSRSTRSRPHSLIAAGRSEEFF